MNRILLPVALLAFALVGCNSDPDCPFGTYPLNGTCYPFDGDATSDTGTGGSDAAGNDTGASDTGASDTGASDTSSPDAGTDATADTGNRDTGNRDTGGTDTGADTICTPSCFGMECGDDGCGGSCGTCRDGLVCQAGICAASGPIYDECPDLVACLLECGDPDGCYDRCRTDEAPADVAEPAYGLAACAWIECSEFDTLSGSWITCVADACAGPAEACLDLGPPTGDGACNNRADLAVLADRADDIEEVIGNCAFTCFSGGTDIETCAGDCVEEDTGLSAGCSDCFGGVSACTFDACVFSCFEPGSPECLACVQESCGPDFEDCAGIAIP